MFWKHPLNSRVLGCTVAIIGLLRSVLSTAGAELEIVLPLGRTAYQTNEWIDLSVVRHGADSLDEGELRMKVGSDDGSKLEFTFRVPAVAKGDAEARRTEHYHLCGWLLRPGHYSIEVQADGATATTELDVFSHVRKTSFRLICWGRAKGEQQLVEGEDSLGFNLFYGHYGRDDEANFIRAGVDFMSCCTMSGGHQMDLRSECDWSDPCVTRGGTRRVVHRALVDRTRPNVFGVHFYDEPGLTWHKHPVTGEWTPHGLPSQVRSYESAFGEAPIPYNKVRPDHADDVARWRHWAIWKLGFMDAAWKEAQFGVSYVRPDYLSVTQSQYGFSAFTDGYYFNVARSLPVTSGHGGYDDYGCGYFNPSYFLEMARARDFDKPCWYLPTWYGNTPSDRFRLEQYLSFVTNIQGMITPPDIDPFEPTKKPAADGVVESNRLMARLGTVFATMPVTRPPVAMLYSMSHNIHVQTLDRQANYAHANLHGQRLPLTYLAGKLLKHQFLAVVEEDIVDGTLAAHHKAIVLTSIGYLPPEVIAALENFAEHGGLVMLTADCQVKIRGAVNLGIVPDLPDAKLVRKLHADGKHAEAGPYETVGKLMEGAAPLAAAIGQQLDRAGIKPVFQCDQPGIVASRQAQGDVEYLFAVNASYDPVTGGRNAIRAAEATIRLDADGRSVYDAVRGGLVSEFQPHANHLVGQFRFGPGQMRVFARTATPIAAVQTLPPVLRFEHTRAEQPLYVELGGLVLDDQGHVVSGSIPLQVRVTDPFGKRRYDLLRATDQGILRLKLPLAVNDPAGDWQVEIRELLNDKRDVASFQFHPQAQCGAAAGATYRAVSFGNDADNIFRFFRVHHDVTIVTGSSDYHQPAAGRLTEILKPWGVRCRTVTAAEVNRPRPLSENEAKTWVGLEFGRAQPGAKNSVGKVGFDVQGPVVLLGTPEDNPIVQFVEKQKFLPYPIGADNFPGRGRGMLAWQRDAVGAGQESITLIAYDAAGMSEAVGTLYEAVAGMQPLTRFVMPSENAVTPASRAAHAKPFSVVWQLALPDRAIAIKVVDGNLRVLTWDGSLLKVDTNGQVAGRQIAAVSKMEQLKEELSTAANVSAIEAVRQHAPPGRIVKTVAPAGELIAVGYWGGTLQLLDNSGKVKNTELLPQDIAGLAWFDGKLVVGLADGRLMGLVAD